MSKTYSAGIVTAYGAAKRAGYQGTYEDFCRQQAQYVENAQAVEQAKTDAINAKNDAVTAKNTAVSAKDDAVSAKNTAVSAKDDAVSAKNTASTKAQEASASATSAGQSATSADQSARSAEQSAQDISGSLAQIQTNKEDIDTLKADLDNILPDYNTLNKTVIDGRSINSDTGDIIINAGTSYAEIPVVPGLNISGYTRGGLDVNHGYAFYNSNGVFISGGNNIGAGTYNWNYNVTAPEGAYIFRIACTTSYISSFTAKYSDVFKNTIKEISIIPRKTVLYCGPNRTLNTLKKGIEEATKNMDTVLYVDPGTYDLVQEFGSEWFDALTSTSTMSGLVLKNRIHVIFSPNSKVISNYTGTNQYAKSLYSPFNAGAYGFTVENLTLECSNCRYGVHDERNGAAEQYKAEYINCNLYIDNSANTYWTGSTCIGGGLGSNSEIVIKNCVFKGVDAESRAGVYYHQSNNFSNANYKSKVIIKDNFFVTGCVHIDDSRSDSTGNGKTEYIVTNNSFSVKYPSANDEGVYIVNMTNPASVLCAWNNNIRSN